MLTGPYLLHQENLDEIFRLCEERKVSHQLTLRYERILYILQPSDAALKAQGQRVQVYEDQAGNVEIRHNDAVLPARPFDKKGVVTQGAIVGNKLLGSTLAMIQRDQLARDQAQISKGTLRTRERKEVEARLKKLAGKSSRAEQSRAEQSHSSA